VYSISSAGALSQGTPIDVVVSLPVATGVNSFACRNGMLAVAVEVTASDVPQNGYVALYDVSSAIPPRRSHAGADALGTAGHQRAAGT
jgi:hypothetical protein